MKILSKQRLARILCLLLSSSFILFPYSCYVLTHCCSRTCSRTHSHGEDQARFLTAEPAVPECNLHHVFSLKDHVLFTSNSSLRGQSGLWGAPRTVVSSYEAFVGKLAPKRVSSAGPENLRARSTSCPCNFTCSLRAPLAVNHVVF